MSKHMSVPPVRSGARPTSCRSRRRRGTTLCGMP
jgi:hypothetical protein